MELVLREEAKAENMAWGSEEEEEGLLVF